jgi:hypothetical protein
MATTRPSRSHLRAQLLCNRKRRPNEVLGHIRLIGKIDPRFDQSQRLSQAPPPILRTVAD